ncbi:TrlF family AAA-like ATPase [Agromyces soli]
MSAAADPRGSVWRRWDPHIHAPGTILNNQFGADAWDEYLTRIEQSEPRIEALGITDYCLLDDYEAIRAHKAAGRLPNVELIFPNVELRLPTATARDHGVNVHLLISPEDPDHVDEAKRFLRTLRFESGGETYACERGDLMKLGRANGAPTMGDRAALVAGTNLFKVPLEVLKEAFKRSSWAERNILLAVAGGSGDGTSGVRDDGGSLAAVRAEIERIARVIFSSSPQQREFWTGRGALSIDELTTKYDGAKVCLHGSDAHSLERVGVPDQKRYTWIKGDATFESLRQACLEPRERAVVMEEPPSGALPHRVIDRISVTNADWLTESEMVLSPRLVAIIGARGSGKTALADLVAAGAGVTAAGESDQTFLHRARAHLGGTGVTLTWGDGQTTSVLLPTEAKPDDIPGVQYLSQQFVERLCSSEGITDELLVEIERVIYETHPYEERLGTSTFRELLDIRASYGRNLRAHANQEISSLSEQIDNERSVQARLPHLKRERDNLLKLLAEDKSARSKLVVLGGKERSNRLEEVNAELARRQGAVDELRRREQALVGLGAAIADLVSRRLPGLLSELAREHAAAGLTEEDWKSFSLRFAGNPDQIVDAASTAVSKDIARLSGTPLPQPQLPAAQLPSFVPDDMPLVSATLAQLKAEAWRLGELIGLDVTKQKQLNALNTKIAKNEALLVAANAGVASAEGAAARIAVLTSNRKQSYASLFDGFASEEKQLADMYAPLVEILSAEKDTLGKLTFIVRRVVDVDRWAARGEDLMDLRTGTAFRGRGELLRVASEALLPAWESGASSDVADAMGAFRAEHDKHILEQAKVSLTDPDAARAWAGEVSAWLNSTDHISVRYGVQYDGVDIEQLSPGTRGIVLLLLYLAVDQSDDRPLIIDQPEENLDPKSIFVELVHRFVETRSRRQIIIVTHNANLVVNTDADQVIVANAGAHRSGKLPEITYSSGGLENPEIRAHVCEILEGGRPAFEERARRLRIRLL